MPVESQSQWRLMKGLCEGSIKERPGLPSRETACEFLRASKEQNIKALAEHVKRKEVRNGG